MNGPVSAQRVDIDALCELAGRLALPIETVLSYTPRELLHYVKGWSAIREQQHRESWTMHRLFTAVMIQPHTKKAVKPQDILQFPWEKQRKKHYSDSELRSAISKAAARLWQNPSNG